MEGEEGAGIASSEYYYFWGPLGKLERAGIGTVEVRGVARLCYLETHEDFGVIIHLN